MSRPSNDEITDQDLESLVDKLMNVKPEQLRPGVTVAQAKRLGADLKELLAMNRDNRAAARNPGTFSTADTTRDE